MWTLIRILPLIIGDQLKRDENYKNLIQLIEILRFLNGVYYSEQDLTNLTQKISSYLANFKKLYQK
jgi:hypothetical protein